MSAWAGLQADTMFSRTEDVTSRPGFPNTIWVSSQEGHRITAFDRLSGNIVVSIDTTLNGGYGPEHLAFSGHILAVSCQYSNSVLFYDTGIVGPPTGVFINAVSVDNPAGLVAVGPTRFLVGEYTTMIVKEIDVFTGSTVQSLYVGVPPFDLATTYSSGGISSVWIAGLSATVQLTESGGVLSVAHNYSLGTLELHQTYGGVGASTKLYGGGNRLWHVDYQSQSSAAVPAPVQELATPFGGVSGLTSRGDVLYGCGYGGTTFRYDPATFSLIDSYFQTVFPSGGLYTQFVRMMDDGVYFNLCRGFGWTTIVRLRLNNPPVITATSVTPTSGTAPLTVTFSITAADPDPMGDLPLEYYINFGNGSGINTLSSTHTYTYTTPGVYNPYAFVYDPWLAAGGPASIPTVTVLPPTPPPATVDGWSVGVLEF